MNDSAVNKMRFCAKFVQIPLGAKIGIETASLQTKCAWISISPSMSDTYTIRRLGGDKIALLGLFVAALLTARLVVGLRSALVLSEPIPLPGTGLSMSVPMGNGWQSEGEWSNRDGVVALRSSFSLGGGEPTAGVICRHLVTTETTTPRLRFEREAGKVNGDIMEINEKRTDMLIIEWAHVKGRESSLTMFLGTAVLPDDGQLDIEVIEITGDAKQAEQVFNRVVESVNLR
jgi:hypothetical protein